MRRSLVVTCAAALALAAVVAWTPRLPDVEIRYTPRQTQLGRIFPGHPVGQGFVCERDGLHAIEVALVPMRGEAAALELELRVREPDGPLLRRSRLEASELPSRDGWARFEFEPVPDSRGARFYFALAAAGGEASGHSPWIRYRGAPQLVRVWGDRNVPAAALEGEFHCLQPDLRAVAIAIDGLDAAAAPAAIEIRDAALGPEPVRTGSLAPSAPIASGWGFFAVDPIADSRWKTLRYRIVAPPGARIVGDANGPSLITFHGEGTADPLLAGMTCRGVQLADRDLVFRAWSGEGARTLASRLAERAGWKPLLAAIAWLAAIAVALRALVPTSKAS